VSDADRLRSGFTLSLLKVPFFTQRTTSPPGTHLAGVFCGSSPPLRAPRRRFCEKSVVLNDRSLFGVFFFSPFLATLNPRLSPLVPFSLCAGRRKRPFVEPLAFVPPSLLSAAFVPFQVTAALSPLHRQFSLSFCRCPSENAVFANKSFAPVSSFFSIPLAGPPSQFFRSSFFPSRPLVRTTPPRGNPSRSGFGSFWRA